MKKGGTVCTFTIGKPGTSATHLRYIARETREHTGREAGWGRLLLRLPEFLVWDIEPRWFLREAVRWAKAEEQEELHRYRGHGKPRTHYRVLLSFEADLSNMRALTLVKDWLDAVLPEARACAFLHRNTAHLHAHLWIAARQINGKKINLNARAYRQLDEHWNRLYSEAFGRDVQEHLTKKWQTQAYKQLKRAGQTVEKPERAEHSWTPAHFTERERERIGATEDDRDQSRVRADQSQTAREAHTTETAERRVARGERAVTRETHAVKRTVDAAEQAVSEAEQLHQEAQRVAEREHELRRTVEPDRER